MTKKQKRFCDEYLKDLNGAQAAIRAGYSEETARITASKLLTNTNIETYIENQLAELHSKNTADAQEVMEFLTSTLRGEITEQTLKMAGNGTQEITDIGISAKDRLKAAELLGKRYGLFTDKVSMEVVQPVFEGDEALED